MSAWKQITVGGVRLDLNAPAADRITMVGSRAKQIPEDEFARLDAGYQSIAAALVPKGIIAISGGADGMDRLAEDAFGRNVISYRTEHRDREPSFVRTVPPAMYSKALQMVASLHPAWDRVKSEHQALHVRNMAQVLQDDLASPTRFLVCWAPPAGLSVSGGTASAYRLSQIVHGGQHTHNLATIQGQRGFANELRDLGVPVTKGDWAPTPAMTLQKRAGMLLDSGHARIGIVIPVAVGEGKTNAERANLSERYAERLVLAKTQSKAVIVGDAWDQRAVLIAVPYHARSLQDRRNMVSMIADMAKTNLLSRVIVPHAAMEPDADLYDAFEQELGREGLLDSPFDLVSLPREHQGMTMERSTQSRSTRQLESAGMER